MADLLFGTGGVPLTTKSKSTEAGIERIGQLGLGLMELEFVHGVRMSEDMAQRVAKIKAKHKVRLTVHGPYYVNLAARDNKIFYGSIKYITDAMLIGTIAGAESVTFHPGFYQTMSSKDVYKRVAEGIKKIFVKFQEQLIKNSIKKSALKLAPELTGKPTQFGDLEELVKLCQDFQASELRFCFDFAHKFARSNGKFNTYEEFMRMLEYIFENLGAEFLKQMHIHVSAIMHSEKGEKNHVTMLASEAEYQDAGVNLPQGKEIMAELAKKHKAAGSAFNWRDLLRALKKSDVGGFVVCESPNLEMDALLMQAYYRNL